MTKVSGAYESVVRGVSEQVPQDRLSGQHAEQVNMVSDPVHGLARRHGSVTLAEAALPHSYATLLANTAAHRCHSFNAGGEEFDLLYRTGPRPISGAHEDALFCYSHADSAFLPVVIHDTIATQALRNAGASAVGQVGRVVLMAGNAYDTTWTSTELYDTLANQQRLAVWVRGGAYSRTFSVKLTDKFSGAVTTISYETLPSSYPDLLDTSDILSSNPDYQKLVNDRVNEFNGLVTEWIGKAAADIVPANIAAKLKDAYDALGFGAATVVGSTLIIQDSRWSEVAASDDGDNSLIAAVGNVVAAADDMCPVHYVGKVVKVRPSKERPDAAFYLEAYPKDGTSSGVAEVVWREGCAVRVTPNRVFILGVVDAGTFYVSDSIAWLESQVGPTTAEDIPPYVSSIVGDSLTNPMPNFFGRPIDFIGMIQDRLLVGSGPVISASRPGDYFNFFRQSALTIKDDDPFEIFSLGSEEDVIKYATPFNRDLILYGQRGQYAISGRAVLSPRTASIVSVSRHEASIDAMPRPSGNFVFFATKRGPVSKRQTTLRQIQPAALSENPESTDVSQQLNGYLQGTAVELLTTTSPNTVVVRTDNDRRNLYLYNYLDRADNGQRVLDAWHRWTWAPEVGSIVAMSSNSSGDLLVYLVREGSDGSAWLACERFTLTGTTSDNPYLDALRPKASPGALAGLDPSSLAAANGAGEGAWLGSVLEEDIDPPTEEWLGVLYESYVEPSNPYPKDQNGRTVTFGRLTLGKVKVSVAETGGCSIVSHRSGRDATILDFNGFRVGGPGSAPGTQPIVTTTVQAYVGGEVRECAWSIRSKRWLPLTITAIEWAGQIFNRERRA